MKNLVFPLLCLLFATQSCEKKNCESQDPTPTNPGEKIRLDSMAIGQKSRYLFFKGESYYDPQNFDFQYFKDTLVMEVVDKNGDRWLIHEYLTPGSEARLGTHNYLIFPDSVLKFEVQIEADSFRFFPIGNAWISSRFFSNPPVFPLAEFIENPTKIQGWKTTETYSESFWTAYADGYELFGTPFPRLNVLTDNTGMQVDGPGFLYVYCREFGFVKTAWYSWWTSVGFGWDLLPE